VKPNLKKLLPTKPIGHPTDKPRPAGKLREGKVRIIGGQWRSRQISFPAVEGLRPTGDRIRETLFNWLGQNLEGLAVLDLFAGSGALGFEAASRGAAQVTLVEREARIRAALSASKAALQADQVTIVADDALAFLRRNKTVYDVIFADPPFAAGWYESVLSLAAPCLHAHGVLYVESPAALTLDATWVVKKQLKAGSVFCTLLTRVNPST
jgi:16S rRNA (guanine966-N2)-methyltransferase